jgi:hypothetical protein
VISSDGRVVTVELVPLKENSSEELDIRNSEEVFTRICP